MKTFLGSLTLVFALNSFAQLKLPEDDIAADHLKWAGQTNGIAVVLHKVSPTPGAHCVDLAKSGLTVYFQSPDPEKIAKVRKAANEAGLLGESIFAEHSALDRICLADNSSRTIGGGAAGCGLVRCGCGTCTQRERLPCAHTGSAGRVL